MVHSEESHAAITAKIAQVEGWTEPGWFEGQILSLLARAATFRDAYRVNPYVNVSGFDISLGLTGPTLGMSFEFKE